jgi:mannose-1-phosphate guanylyltransferase
MSREPLEAILLVGGQGTRLRPLTLSAPKPLLPTAGVPFLAHLLARAAAGGVTHVVLATCYKAEMFASALGDGAAFGLSIDYVTEEVPLDTAGGIRNAASSLRGGGADPVVVLNSDILSGHDLGAQVDLHVKSDAAATLHLVEVADPSRFGCVPTDESGRVTAFLEKTPNPVTNRINAGCYVFRRDVIDQIPAGRRVSVERETFPGLIEAGQLVMGYPETAYWLDVGTPQTFAGGCRLRRCRGRRDPRCCSRVLRWLRTPWCPAGPWSASVPRSAPGRRSSAACCSTPPRWARARWSAARSSVAALWWRRAPCSTTR